MSILEIITQAMIVS